MFLIEFKSYLIIKAFYSLEEYLNTYYRLKIWGLVRYDMIWYVMGFLLKNIKLLYLHFM